MRIGIKSTAIAFGRYDRLIIGLLQALVLIGLAGIGYYLALSLSYFMGLAIALSLAIYQQFLLKDCLPERCFQAFLNNHWFGMAVFVGLLCNS